MKKILLLLTLFLAGCGSQPVLDTPVVEEPIVEEKISIEEYILGVAPEEVESIIDSKHHTDYIVDPSKPNKKTRIYSGLSNYKDSSGNWHKANIGISSQPNAPADFQGTYNFDRASMGGFVQFFANDAMDAGNRAMVGIRLSDQPNMWLEIKANNIDNAVDVTDIDETTVQWEGLWTDTNYRVKHLASGIKSDFILTGENHPASFTETIKLSPSLTLVDNGDNTLTVKDGENVVFLMPEPFGYVETDETQESVVRVTMEKGAKQGLFETVIITPNPDDLALIGYSNNIVIDPTTIVSSTSEIEDTYMNNGSTDSNFGAGTSFTVGNFSTVSQALVKIVTGAIPEGTYDSFTCTMKSLQARTNTVKVYKVTDGRPWGELTATWNKYDGTNTWTTGGGSSAGNDFVDDASPPQQEWVNDEIKTLTLLTSWLDDWYSGTNNGMTFRWGGGTFQNYKSSENTGGDDIFCTIEFTEGGVVDGTGLMNSSMF